MTNGKTEKEKSIMIDWTLNERLAFIQSNLEVSKSRFNAFGKYYYRSCEDILEVLKPLLEQTKTTLTIGDEIVTVGDRYYVKATVDLEYDGKVISVAAYAREPENKKGMDEAQITGATSSYARKYALNGLFAIDDTKDADTMDNKESLPPKIDVPKLEAAIEKHSQTQTKSEIGPQESKVLNLIIEKLAPQVETGNIVDIAKVKSVILEKYGQLPVKMDSGEVVIKYIADELGINNVSSVNSFLKGIE